VAASIDLSEEQQDRLAEFLLQEDWMNWNSIDPERVEKDGFGAFVRVVKATAVGFLTGKIYEVGKKYRQSSK